ncbi:hypothetical protein DRE_04105 [Drechslerella stenobrocha 248]|uniref:Kinetochore protein mis13 n=1 Tax=Drechslerella stenobrocha 248 TaxID=1043628 RepID=W7I366_9PEZI|nr:hypothetical protein DRE_04105 [Drechslerella stenobrocha 248]
MPAITMASHRPKRKSGTKAPPEDAVESTRGEEQLPPLKKTRRASPDRPAGREGDVAPVKTSTRITRSSTAGGEKSADSIFSSGPSRAKKAKRSRKEKEEKEKQERESTIAEEQPAPPPPPPPPQPRSDSRSSSSERRGRRGRRRCTGQNGGPQGAAVAEGTRGYGGRGRGEKPVVVPLAAIEDTPLVRKRNKEMREANGHRRSSLGLRGRRASSLNNGHIAAPHPDVQPSDFFKHLDAQMIETQRMQQLLAWCSKCALSEKRARGRDAQSNARAAARVIEEDILADLTEKKLNVNWWESSEGAEDAEEVPKKPHPKNEDHKRKIAVLEEQLEQLRREKRAWKDIGEVVPAKLPKPQREGEIRPLSLDVSLLRPEEASVIPQFEESDKAIDAIQQVMSKGRGSIEFKVDQFSHGMHKAQQYSQHAKDVSEMVLARASSVLNVREEAAKKAAGTTALPLHEVLKSISHLGRG